MNLVTGATGFLGSMLTRQLVEEGESVRILRRENSKLDLLSGVAEVVDHAIGDVTDYPSVRAAIQGVSRVYHVAAYVGFGGRKDKDKLMEINVGGTANVASAANDAEVDRLVHVSSIAALGRKLDQKDLINETVQWSTSAENSAYAISKHLAEMEVHRAIAEGLDAVLVNPALIFGLGRAGENTMAIVEKVRDGRLPAIPSGGTCVVDVEDVASGIRLAMKNGATGERYILSGDNLLWAEIFGALATELNTKLPRLTLNRRPAVILGALFETFSSLIGVKPLITRETARTATSTHYYSNAKARGELGCSFRPFTETVGRIADTMR